jgi:3-oxoacyl-[acyl-carrier protein] reductase
MDLGLDNRRALVMGSTGGMGEAIARRLSSEGSRVVIAGRSSDKAVKIAKELNDALSCTLDLADVESVDAAIQMISSHWGGVDIIVCNGGGPPPGPIALVEHNVWNAQFETMFTNQIRLVNAFLPGMRERGWGRILAISSSGIQQPIPNLGISNAIRGAQVGWAKTLANEVAAEGVTVNICAPGRIDTDRLKQLDQAAAQRLGKDIQEIEKDSKATIPLGRYGTVAEFADTAVFLLSANASYITGGVIRIDGGMIRGI